ncbi:hypothetical protein [Clostridium folliculivorans]|uniref:Uncharacterized protein n=1 Tax=Clostridium folliculivorans TaxID=2886038 RepID=A0A9W6DBH7_9CLOT|nr:hypothetical protein [Clostridium folliculivorans]GKU26279.1 hypothetical protein CFOLD11_31060 [Clostridium folliculivorans]GKU31951.1 hypothetical protein CFB3_40590 [Clostridium folliculivorans]
MIKQVLKNIRTYKNMVIIFILILTICQLSITLFTVGYKNTVEGLKKENNGLESTSINVTVNGGLKDKGYLLDIFNNTKEDIQFRLVSNVSINKIEGKPRIYIDLYKNNKSIVTLPTIKGSNFNKEDIKNGNTVLIGKNLYRDLKLSATHDTIIILGKEYTVKGIIGDDRFNTNLDYSIVLACNDISKDFRELIFKNGGVDMILNGKGNEVAVAKELSRFVSQKEEYPSIEVKAIESNQDILLNAFGDNTYFLILIIMTYILAISACIYIINYLIKIMEPKLSIRIAFGSSIINTMIFMFVNIIIMALVATMISIVLLMVIKSYLANMINISFGLYLDNLAISIALCMSNSLIIVGINLFNILRINPSTNINKI